MSSIESKREGAKGSDREAWSTLLSTVRARVDERLARWLPPRVAAAAQISEEVAFASEAVADLALRGGKRMRAALVGAGFEACGASESRSGSNPSWTPCEEAMMAVELLQTYLLIHDDWMDDDDTRRGGPSVHVGLRAKLGAPGLGDAAAVLAGDLASGYAQEALLETNLPAGNVLAAARAFAKIQVEVVTGQLAEMRGEHRVGPLPSVETIHALKTASYTVTGPLLVGAALAGADSARFAELERYGRPLGIAFQLRDDLLGTFGDPSATGKPVWNDIKQGKRTALVAELRGDAKAEALLERAKSSSATTDDVRAVVSMMEESGAKSRVEARVRDLCHEAERALDAMRASRADDDPMSTLGQAWLRGAITALGERST